MTTPATIKSTGPSSTSFQVWAATFIPGVLAAIQALVDPTSPTHQAVFGGGGLLLALVSTVFKLIHDQGLNKATLSTAGSDLAQALPAIRKDLSVAVSFAENDLPGVKSLLGGLDGRVAALESKVVANVPDISSIETVVRQVLTELLKPTPPAA
jgi:hypothetical protein